MIMTMKSPFCHLTVGIIVRFVVCSKDCLSWFSLIVHCSCCSIALDELKLGYRGNMLWYWLIKSASVYVCIYAIGVHLGTTGDVILSSIGTNWKKGNEEWWHDMFGIFVMRVNRGVFVRWVLQRRGEAFSYYASCSWYYPGNFMPSSWKKIIDEIQPPEGNRIMN